MHKISITLFMCPVACADNGLVVGWPDAIECDYKLGDNSFFGFFDYNNCKAALFIVIYIAMVDRTNICNGFNHVTTP